MAQFVFSTARMGRLDQKKAELDEREKKIKAGEIGPEPPPHQEFPTHVPPEDSTELTPEELRAAEKFGMTPERYKKAASRARGRILG